MFGVAVSHAQEHVSDSSSSDESSEDGVGGNYGTTQFSSGTAVFSSGTTQFGTAQFTATGEAAGAEGTFVPQFAALLEGSDESRNFIRPKSLNTDRVYLFPYYFTLNNQYVNVSVEELHELLVTLDNNLEKDLAQLKLHYEEDLEILRELVK